MSAEPQPEGRGVGRPSDAAGDQESWRLTLACTKAQAEAVADVELDGAVLVATEEDEAAGRWRLHAYLEGEPTPEALATVRALVPGAQGSPEPLAGQDWVTISQAGLEPIREGRFVVHTSAFPADPPPGGRAFLIEAGQAFGTGHHETTAGCLAALDGYEAERTRFRNVVDLGSGTGILAFAAQALWPDARVLATDIDPVAAEVLRANALANYISLGERAGEVSVLIADGVRHPGVLARAPFDLVVANILAGPLIDMAPEIVSVAAPAATILLAGLLTTQAEAVSAAYLAAGCTASRRAVRGDWTIMELVAPVKAGGPRSRPAGASGDRNAWATDG